MMEPFESTVDVTSETYRRQREGMLDLVAQVRALEARVRAASAKARPKFDARKQILPRERVARLLDHGTPFLELATLAGYRQDEDDPDKTIPGGGSIIGIGYVSGVRCIIVASDSGITAAARPGGQKAVRAQHIALQSRLPLVNLVESGGANLRDYQMEHFVYGGEMFFNMAKLSAAGVPVISAVHGNCTAGGAYIPGMSDYVIMVRGRGKAFLAGAPLVKAATGEDADEQSLGGAEMHATISGLAEYLAEDDADAIRLTREVMAALDWNCDRPITEPEHAEDPRYDPDELCGVVPLDYRKPYDMREVAARIADGSRWSDFKPLYGPDMVCLRATVGGYACGFIGNNGPITPNGATKCAQFIQLCCQTRTPLVFLTNTTGYVVGTDPEQGGMIKHGSKMIQAVSNATVPRITFNIGASFGAGNYGMCGRAYKPHFLFAWPNAHMNVMGGEQAATTMSIVVEASMKRRGMEMDPTMLAAMKQEIVDLFNRQEDALYATARGLDDGIIDPRDTRRVLTYVLSICAEAERRTMHPNTFGVARQ